MTQPVDTTVVNGDVVRFFVETTGEVASYQWQYSRDGRRWTDLDARRYGAFEDLTLTVGRSENGYQFRVVVTFADNDKITSDAAKLTVCSLIITEQPKDTRALAGEKATFSVETKGSAFSYQWQTSKDGKRWSNLSTWTYGSRNTLSYKVGPKDDGLLFRVVVTASDFSKVTSEPAKLTIGEPITYKARTLPEVTVEGVSVKVDAPEGMLPSNAEMSVVPADVSEYAELIAAVAGDNAEVLSAVDISFSTEEDGEIEPNGDVIVYLSVPGLSEMKDVKVVHISDDGVATLAEQVPVETKRGPADLIAIKAKDFSKFVIVHIVVDVEGGTYTNDEESQAATGLAVSVTTEDNTFDEPVVLTVESIAEGSDAYNTAAEELEKIGHEYDGMVAFDIRFNSVATGAEVEPNIPVDVKIEIVDAAAAGVPEEEVGYVTIAHILDQGGAEIVSAPPEASVEDTEPEFAFPAEVFSSFTITWRNNGRTVRVIYEDTSGNELTITNPSSYYPNLTASSGSPAFLIYDIEGYHYDHTYRNSDTTSNKVGPILSKNDNNRWRCATNTTSDSSAGWTEMSDGDVIHVVYAKNPAVTTGGTPEIQEDAQWPAGDDAPQFSKSSTNQTDGTNLVSLSITAGTKPYDKKTPADVIVVFDVSGSMNYDMNGNTTTNNNNRRITQAKNAVNTMANTLLNNSQYDVQMALISFSNSAKVEQELTSNYTTFTGKVNALSANGGTNWEYALQLANEMSVRPKAATFVVFVTDGDPTFRISRGDIANTGNNALDDETQAGGEYYYLRCFGVYGQGNDDDWSRNFNFAVTQVQAIKSANKNFYSIGISNSVTKVRNLTTQGGYPENQAFLCTNNAAMTSAFESITEAIKATLGFGDVGITDGITELSSTEMEMMHSVDPNSFTYYITDNTGRHEWETREADGCGPATYDEANGKVLWNMGEGFQLADDVVYEVTFRVWPSQDAYDLIANLNNGVVEYDSLTDAQKSQIIPVANSNPVRYTLKTNTDQVGATYKKTAQTGEVVSVVSDAPITATYHAGDMENMPLTSMLLKIHKDFEDDLTSGSDRETEVKLVLLRRNAYQDPTSGDFVDFAPYPVPQAGGEPSAEITLNASNNWTYTVYIAPGFEVGGEVLEHGYEFTLSEPQIDYHYSLVEEILNPMVVDGVDTFVGDGFLVDDQAQVAQYVDQSLTAVNRVKSGIDIRKILKDDVGVIINTEDEFTITGKLLGPDGNPFIWNDGDDVDASGAYHKYTPDPNGTVNLETNLGAEDFGYGVLYTQLIKKGHFADSSNISFTLKPGEFIRFINVPEGCTFEFTESSTMPVGYELDKVTAVCQHRVSAGGDFITEGDVQPTVTNNVASLTRDLEADPPLTGVVGNKQYVVEITNKSVHGEYFFVYHSSDNTIEKIFADDDRVDKTESNGKYTYTFNIVDETKTGYLYGGYAALTTVTTGQGENASTVTYLPYKGAGMTDDQIRAAEYTSGSSGTYTYATTEKPHPTTGYWYTDSAGQPYTGATANQWTLKSMKTTPGNAMSPEANGVYYLKEVPDQYFRPALYYVQDNNSPNVDIVKMYLLLPVDDSLYQYVNGRPITLTNNTKLYTTFKVTDSSGNSTSIKVPTVNSKLVRGFLAVWDAYDKIKANTSYEWTPNFVTKDGIEVTSVVTRTISFGANVGYAATNFSDAGKDVKVASTYSVK